MTDIDQKVEDWHNGAGEGQELHEYLGLSWEEYIEQCVPIPKELFERCEEIRKLAEENRKREAALARPVDITVEEAFNIAFERYEDALKELAKK